MKCNRLVDAGRRQFLRGGVIGARVTARIIDMENEDDLFVSMFDHGGSAGGYENTWGTGKLYFDSMKVRNCHIHNRPAYNSDVHSTRDMGVGELKNAYGDHQVTDTIVLVGTNPLECQTNLFLNHMIPGMRNGARIVIVDPRRTVTANAFEEAAGAENVLHPQIAPGTDLALANAIFTHIANQGWVDADFIAASTYPGDVAQPVDEAHPSALGSFEAAREAYRMSIADAAESCGVAEADIVKAAEWIAQPKGDGVCRLEGHQEGYFRPSDAPVGRPAPYLDQLIIAGQGKVHHVWAVDHYKTTLNASEFKRVYNRRSNMVKEAMDARAGATREEMVDAIVGAIEAGGLFVVNMDVIHTQIGQAAHALAANQAFLDTARHGRLEQVPQQVAVTEPAMAVLGEHQVIRHAIGQVETAKPAMSKVQVHLLTQATLRPDAEAIADQQNADQQLGIDRRTAPMVIEICKMGTDAAQVDKPVNGSKQMVLRDVILKRELVEQRRLRFLPRSHHRRHLPFNGSIEPAAYVQNNRSFSTK